MAEGYQKNLNIGFWATSLSDLYTYLKNNANSTVTLWGCDATTASVLTNGKVSMSLKGFGIMFGDTLDAVFMGGSAGLYWMRTTLSSTTSTVVVIYKVTDSQL